MAKLRYEDFFDFDDSTPVDQMIKKIEKLEDVYKTLIGTVESNIKTTTKQDDALKKSAESMVKILEKVNIAMEDGRKSVDDSGKSTQALVVQNEKLEKSAKENEDSLKKLTKGVDGLTQAKKDLTKANDDEAGSIKDVQKQLKLAEKEYKALGNTVDDAIKKESLQRVEGLSKEYNGLNKSLKEAKKSAVIVTGSYNELNKKVLDGRKRLKEMSGGLEGTSQEFKDLQKEVGENIETLKEWDKSIGDNFRSVGDYEGAMDNMVEKLGEVPGATGSAAQGVKGLGAQLKALLANPIVLLIAAIVAGLSALFAAFKQSAAGADFFAKAAGFLKGLMSAFVGIVDDLRKRVISAFEDPKQALMDFGKLLLDNIINRFLGIIELGKSVAKILGGVFTLSLEQIEEGALDAGQALIQMSTGFDKEQQKELAEGLTEIAKRAKESADAFGLLADRQRELIRINRTREANLLRIQKIAETNLAIQEDDTRGFEERERAAEKARIAQEKAAKLQLQIAQDNLSLLNQEVALTKANAGDVEEILDRQLEANKILLEAEKELLLTELDNAEKRRRLVQDKLERDLDILIDGFDNQKGINERIIADEKRVFGERRALLEETRKLGKDSFDEQIATIQTFTDKAVDANDLLATSDARVLNEKIRSLELSEIIEGRLLEVIRDRRTAVQDLAEADRDLTQMQLDSQNRRIQSDMRVNEIIAERINMQQELEDEILKETKLFAGDERVSLLKDRLSRETVLINARFQEEIRLANESITDIDERNAKIQELAEQNQNDLTDISREGSEERVKIQMEEFNKITGLFSQATDATMGILEARWDREDIRRDEQAEKLKMQLDTEIELAGDNEARKALIFEEFAAKQEALDKEQAKADRKRAIFEKTLAAFEIGINTAKAVIKSVAASPLTGGLPFSAIVAAIGAAQIAAVLAAPIPQFAKGTKSAPEGLAVVNELGQEIIESTGGKRRVVGSDGAALTHLTKGDKVYTAEESKRMIERDIFNGSGNVYRNGADVLAEQNQSSDALSRVMSKGFNTLNDTVRNKREVHVNITKRGIDLLAKNSNNWTKFVDNNYA